MLQTNSEVGTQNASISESPSTDARKRQRPGDADRDEDLTSFFKRLSDDSCFSRLFTEPGVVLSLFRSLPDEHKCTVLRLLDLSEAIRWEPVIIWHGHERQSALESISALRALRLLKVHRPARGDKQSAVDSNISAGRTGSSPRSAVESVTGSSAGTNITKSGVGAPTGAVRYELHPVFQSTLRACFYDGATVGFSGKSPKHFPTKAVLHSHAAQKWRNMLQWIVRPAPVVPSSALIGAPHEISSSSILNRILQVLSQGAETPRVASPTCSDLIAILKKMHLIKESRELLGREDLTSQTFQWLLKDIRSQVCSICVEYLRCVHYGQFVTRDTTQHANAHGGDKDATMLPPAPTAVAASQMVEVLGLLFTLSELLIGQPCSASSLTAPQRRFLQFAFNIGLVWMHKPVGAKHFFPTPFVKLLQPAGPNTMHITAVASNLAVLSSGKQTGSSGFELPDDLYYPEASTEHSNLLAMSAANLTPLDHIPVESGVVVESNFKVFAYTACSLLITVVVRLCEVRVITPCLIVGVLTRETVRDAYKAGVTAEQIIRFFTTHGHPSIYAKALREENVAAQLIIWEEERKRVKMHKACVLDFSKEQDLDVFPLAVARSRQCLIMHTECPSTTDTNSEEFQKWKVSTLDKMKARPQAGELSRASSPVLAVHAQYKDELTNLVRVAIRSVRR